MSGNNYLTDYERSLTIISRGPAHWLRQRLDSLARAAGQRDRHALFLPRVFDLAGLSRERQDIHVLEIGCGSGWALSYTAPNVRYTAYDYGTRFEGALKEQGIEFHSLDAESEPFPSEDQRFDIVMLNHLIEHIRKPDRLLNEIRRVMNTGATLYVRTPNVARVGWGFFDDYTHVKPYTPEGLHHLMRSFGFAQCFRLNSDHPRIMLDIATGGRFRNALFGERFGGKEIEAGFVIH